MCKQLPATFSPCLAPPPSHKPPPVPLIQPTIPVRLGCVWTSSCALRSRRIAGHHQALQAPACAAWPDLSAVSGDAGALGTGWPERLATTPGLDSGTLTPLLKRLEAQGLVRRQRSAEDERRPSGPDGCRQAPACEHSTSQARLLAPLAAISKKSANSRPVYKCVAQPAGLRCRRLQFLSLYPQPIGEAPSGHRHRPTPPLPLPRGRAGTAKSSDGALEVTLSTPKELHGAGVPGTNPEQLFAAGYRPASSAR